MRVAIFNNFANYTNRVEHRLETYDDYILAVGAGNSFGPFNKINFKNRDGITTSQVVNLPKGTENFKPNYLLVLKENTDDIVSRWFVTESYETRAYQFNLSLVRDIIADNWETVLDTPSVVSRGWARVGSGTNSPIFNSEGFSCSQVKQTEHLLKDKTGSAWVVAYIKNYDTDPAPETPDEITFYSSPGNTKSEPESVTAMFEGTAATGYAYDRQMADRKIVTHCVDMSGTTPGAIYAVPYTMDDSHGYRASEITVPSPSSEYGWYFDGFAPTGNYWTAFNTAVKRLMSSNQLWESVDTSFDNKELTAGRPWNDEVDQYIGQKFYDPASKPYVLGRVEIPSKFLVRTSAADIEWWSEKIGHIIKQADVAGDLVSQSTVGVKEPFGAATADYIELELMTYTYVRQYVGLSEDKVTLALNHANLTDRPWSMCAVPVDAINIVNRSVPTTPGVAKAFASALSEQLGEKVLDVQLLPYCPCPDFISGNAISLTGLSEHVDYEWIKSGNNIVTILLWARNCSSRIQIPFTRYNLPDDPVEFKLEQETKLYRLTAPNYSSSWEFSICKNRGLYAFDVDFTYEPYNSYLRVAPHFGGLYGANFGDSRGLIISCDTSLPKISDNWVNYQLQNANYQKVFDRQIKTQEIGIALAGFNAAADIAMTGLSIGSGINGLKAGAKALSMNKAADDNADMMNLQDASFALAQNQAKYDAKLGQLRSNVAFSSLQGGIEAINDLSNLGMQIRSMEDAKFNHEMNISNIKAQPQTITQIGAFNVNNKLFPVLEVYDATESEKDNIREFIKYRSMNIGRTATIRDYLSDNPRTWIEAALIDTFSYNGDSHELAYLKNELQKGVFIYV